MNNPFEDHHKIVTKNEALLTPHSDTQLALAMRCSLRRELNFRRDFTTPM